MKKLWYLKNGLSYLELEGQGRGIIMEVTRSLLLGGLKHFGRQCTSYTDDQNIWMYMTILAGLSLKLSPFKHLNHCRKLHMTLLKCFVCYILCSKTKYLSILKGRFIYTLDSSNSSSFTFLSSKLAYGSRSNLTGIWTSDSNGSWTDKHSSDFSTAKEMSITATFFFL